MYIHSALFSILLFSITASAKADDEPIFSFPPPVEIDLLIKKLITGENIIQTIEKLCEIDKCAPYLRSIPNPEDNQKDYRKDIARILKVIEEKTLNRNRKQFTTWVRDGRIDLCGELLVSCNDEAIAVELADSTLALRKRIANNWSQMQPRPINGYEFGPSLNMLKGSYPKYWGEQIDISFFPGQVPIGCFVRANQCNTDVFSKNNWFVSVRNQLSETPKKGRGKGHWNDSFLLINNNAEMPRLDGSLLICDGDIHLSPGVNYSVIIANGNITSMEGSGGSGSYLCASKSIYLPNRNEIGGNYFHSGKELKIAKSFILSSRTKQNQQKLPFGIRFVDPIEFGLTLIENNKIVRFANLEPRSLFDKSGFKNNDIITKIDNNIINDLPSFRRALRQGIVRESAIFHIIRNEQKMIRIVFFNGVPLPLAPHPRKITPN